MIEKVTANCCKGRDSIVLLFFIPKYMKVSTEPSRSSHYPVYGGYPKLFARRLNFSYFYLAYDGII